MVLRDARHIIFLTCSNETLSSNGAEQRRQETPAIYSLTTTTNYMCVYDTRVLASAQLAMGAAPALLRAARPPKALKRPPLLAAAALPVSRRSLFLEAATFSSVSVGVVSVVSLVSAGASLALVKSLA